MPNKADNEARERALVHQALALTDAAAIGSGRPYRALKVSVGNVDLPCHISHGRIYIQAPLAYIFDAFGEDLSDFVRDLEVRISEAGRGPLSRASVRSTAYRAGVAKSRMVRSGRKQ